MLRENANARARHLAAYTTEKLVRRYTTCRARIYLRIVEDDPPNHPARFSLCTLKNWWSMAPPYHTLPARAGEARAGPRPVRRFAFPRGGDG